MVLKLYAVSDGPPSLSCRQVLAALDIPFELIDVNFNNGEHMTEEYAKVVSSRRRDVLKFYVQYSLGFPLLLVQHVQRAIINHRLQFNLTTYYANISAYTMAPIFFDYQRTAEGLKRVYMAMDVFETYLMRTGTSYVAADHLTIADFPLVNTTMTLEAVGVDITKYTKICKWYNDFKKNHPELWQISANGMKEIQYFEANPPDLSHLNHPIHPARKTKK